MVLDTTRICIPRGMDKNGKVDGLMRRKIVKLLHVPHLREVKTGGAAEKRSHWPTMWNEVCQEVKSCETCINNANFQPAEPPPQEHEFASYPMQKCSADLFHFGGTHG